MDTEKDIFLLGFNRHFAIQEEIEMHSVFINYIGTNFFVADDDGQPLVGIGLLGADEGDIFLHRGDRFYFRKLSG